MSELIYLLGEIDHRVRPLIYCIHHWAKSNQIVRSYPAISISNFGLICLVVYFLQQLHRPILPSIVELNREANETDIRHHESGCVQFIRNINAIKFRTKNSDSESKLLWQFFHFYGNFDFTTSGVSTHTGCQIERVIQHHVMHVVNPIDPTLNVTTRIHYHHLKYLQSKMRRAAYLLEGQMNKKINPMNKDWGILLLFNAMMKV